MEEERERERQRNGGNWHPDKGRKEGEKDWKTKETLKKEKKKKSWENLNK